MSRQWGWWWLQKAWNSGESSLLGDLCLVMGNSRIIIMQLAISRMSGSRQHATHSQTTLLALHLPSMHTNTGTGRVPNILRLWKHHGEPRSHKAFICLALGVSFNPQEHHPHHVTRLTLGWMIKELFWKTQPSLDSPRHHWLQALCEDHSISISTSLLTCISEALNTYTH